MTISPLAQPFPEMPPIAGVRLAVARAGYKGPITQAAGTVAAEYILVQMCAAVAAGQATPADAAKEAERRARRYYR